MISVYADTIKDGFIFFSTSSLSAHSHRCFAPGSALVLLHHLLDQRSGWKVILFCFDGAEFQSHEVLIQLLMLYTEGRTQSWTFPFNVSVVPELIME